MVVVPPETFMVTTFWPYWGATLRLQFGGAHVAVTMLVPPVLAVKVSEFGGGAVLVLLVVAARVPTPAGIEDHVKMGAMLVPLLSSTSAIRFCVLVGERLKTVLELAAS